MFLFVISSFALSRFTVLGDDYGSGMAVSTELVFVILGCNYLIFSINE
jgi:hypothetical protein